jgi:hypothetical protein
LWQLPHTTDYNSEFTTGIYNGFKKVVSFDLSVNSIAMYVVKETLCVCVAAEMMFFDRPAPLVAANERPERASCCGSEKKKRKCGSKL